jgi:two-component system, NarL family, nitrate/nitrite response regulator NarL
MSEPVNNRSQLSMTTWCQKFRVLIVEDDNLLRETLVELLDLQPDIKVVGGVSSVADARDYLRNERIDVVLLDYHLTNGLAFALIEDLPRLPIPPRLVLLLSREMRSSAMHRLASKGVKGILWKNAGFRALTRAIRQAALDPSKAMYVKAGESAAHLEAPTFTNRQMDIARAVLMGCATKEIAGELDVSESAVKSTIQQLFAKTGTRSRPQLVRALLEQQWLNPLAEKYIADVEELSHGTATA